MPILLFVFALFLPRVVIFLLWLFTEWFEGIFNGWLVPIIGFLFLPYTLLWYSAVGHWYGGEWNGFVQIAVLIVALIADLSPSGLFGGKKEQHS